MSAILQENETEILQNCLERLPDSFVRVRVVIAMKGDNRTLDFLAEIEQLSFLSQERGIPPDCLIDIQIKLHN
jgi:hypothetical protein